MVVEFRLLGDIEARIDGRPVEIGHARQRCVLVALLIEANRPVPVDQLVDRVWADRPPQRAHNAVSGYLSRLRQVLAPAEGVQIARQPGGYLLKVDPMSVDLHRFHALLAQARATERAEDAGALFEQALRLWRGEAFATLDTPWLNAVRNALDAARLAAEQDRNDIALDRGQHASLLGELTASAAAHPLDERLAGQLMLALYRCGRQADALEAYQQVRQRLVEELGTDPSKPLRELHRQILTADPVLAGTPPHHQLTPRVGARSPVPRQLPAPPRSFTGRAQELAALDALLAEDEQSIAVVVSTVSGTAGVGKTALAVHWAHRVADRFPDGQLYVNLRGFDPGGTAMAPADAIRSFLDALGVPPEQVPTDLDAQAGLYRSLLAGKRMLVVLDNARDAEQVRPLLPGAPGCSALVTSRNQLTGLTAAEGAHPTILDVLTTEESRELLARRLGPQRVMAEPRAVDEIITRCARLPLALAIVAARAATHPHFPLAVLAGELRKARARLDALHGGDATTDVRTVFSWSYQRLSPAAAGLFRLLGLHPGPDVTPPAAASLAGLPSDQMPPLLAELTRAHLLDEHTPGRYTFHDLLRAYATDQAHIHERDTERHAALHRVLDHYLHTAHTAALLVEPHREPLALSPSQPGVTPEPLADHSQALAWFTAEQPVLLSAVRQAAGAGFDTHTWQLAWTLTSFLDRQGHWHDRAATQEAALDAARRLADPIGQAHAHSGLAGAYLRLGRHDDAHNHFRHSLDLYGEIANHADRAYTRLGLAAVCAQQGRYTEALNHTQHALTLYHAIGHRPGHAFALHGVGWYHTLSGDHQQALTYCQQALNLHQQLGDRYGEANTWDSLGHAHHHLGQHTQAITCYQHALDLFRDLGDRYGQADTLTNLGDTHHTIGDPAAARTAWQHALDILDQLDHPDAEQVRAKLQHLNQHDANRSSPRGARSRPVSAVRSQDGVGAAGR